MEKMPPKSFIRADKHNNTYAWTSRTINLDACEEEVRKEICDVICSNSDLADCTPSDFDMRGKQVVHQTARQPLFLMHVQ